MDSYLQFLSLFKSNNHWGGAFNYQSNDLFNDNSIFLGKDMDSDMLFNSGGFNSGRSPFMDMMDMFSLSSFMDLIEIFAMLTEGSTKQKPYEGSPSRAQGFEGEQYLKENPDETIKYHGKQLKTLDTDGDGVVSLPEAREAVGEMADYIDLADGRNGGKGDGKITVWENLALSIYQDGKNEDGEITPEEQDEFMAKYEADPYSVTRGVREAYNKYVKPLRENFEHHGTIYDQEDKHDRAV